MQTRKWLKSFAKKNSLDQKIFADQAGVSPSAVRAWIHTGVVPRQKYWPGIAGALGIPFKTVVSNYFEQLHEEDRVTSCIVCETQIVKWTPHILLCKSNECRKVYDVERKRIQRSWLKENMPPLNVGISRFFLNVNETLNTKSKKETREEINIEMQKYLNNGGTVKQLEPGNAEGSDKLTVYLIENGLGDFLYD